MRVVFSSVGLEHQSDYLQLLKGCPVKSSDYSFINIWGWADAFGLEWARHRGLIWLRQSRPEPLYWAPVGDWDRTDWQQCFSEVVADRAAFTRIPETLKTAWQQCFKTKMVFEDARDQWDYLYAVSDLIALKGNRLHKKKNLLNQFKKRYAYRYVALEQATIELALGMQERWCTWRDCESHAVLAAENRAVAKVLRSWPVLHGAIGGAVLVDDQIAAYTIAEPLAEDTLLVHFEKGDPAYKGVYQAINQMFLSREGLHFTRVNREADLGDEGLRKAKMSYQPVGFLKKYTAVFDRKA